MWIVNIIWASFLNSVSKVRKSIFWTFKKTHLLFHILCVPTDLDFFASINSSKTQSSVIFAQITKIQVEIFK